ncbi:hypothetical protein C8R44DRAFT_893400 [Mycena epipterygia]|nr:hypothetical protein C8R44DRAFT_893400 [Mycena epipterygia]
MLIRAFLVRPCFCPRAPYLPRAHRRALLFVTLLLLHECPRKMYCGPSASLIVGCAIAHFGPRHGLTYPISRAEAPPRMSTTHAPAYRRGQPLGRVTTHSDVLRARTQRRYRATSKYSLPRSAHKPAPTPSLALDIPCPDVASDTFPFRRSSGSVLR